jgi:hypothetical protein
VLAYKTGIGDIVCFRKNNKESKKNVYSLVSLPLHSSLEAKPLKKSERHF